MLAVCGLSSMSEILQSAGRAARTRLVMQYPQEHAVQRSSPATISTIESMIGDFRLN